ncbi:MAG: trehalose utilization protein [Fibrobacteres bacterium]|nr:trehalose utilization protein [Fibrobacterota bacterium]
MSGNPGNLKVTVWNEFLHEKKAGGKPAEIYPQGIHAALAAHFSAQPGITARTATLEEPEHGLTKEVLADTDVLFWWGHMGHDKVDDGIVQRVQQEVLAGMGLVVLHSGHAAKVFKALLGTNCSLKWREADEKEIIHTIAPNHPIARGVGERIILEHHEMYGERHEIPEPDQVIFISWFAGGNVFRSGCTWERGLGRLFYFSPGHETYPIYHRQDILKVLVNAAHWAGEPAAAMRAVQGGAPRTGTANSVNEKEPVHPL